MTLEEFDVERVENQAEFAQANGWHRNRVGVQEVIARIVGPAQKKKGHPSNLPQSMGGSKFPMDKGTAKNTK